MPVRASPVSVRVLLDRSSQNLSLSSLGAHTLAALGALMNQLIASTDQLTPREIAKRKRCSRCCLSVPKVLLQDANALLIAKAYVQDQCTRHVATEDVVEDERFQVSQEPNKLDSAAGSAGHGSAVAGGEADEDDAWDALSQGVPSEGVPPEVMSLPYYQPMRRDTLALGCDKCDNGCDECEMEVEEIGSDVEEPTQLGCDKCDNGCDECEMEVEEIGSDVEEPTQLGCDKCDNGCDECELEVEDIASDVEEPTHEELPIKEIPLARDHKAYNMRLNDDHEKLFLEKMKALRAAVELKRMPRKKDDFREVWSAHRDSFQINLGEQNSTQGQGVGDMPSSGALYLADNLETDLSKGETPPCLTNTDVEAFVRALHSDGKLRPTSKLGVCFMPRERPAYRDVNVKKIFKEIEGVFQQLESMYQAKGFPLAHELAQLICKSGNTCTFTVSEPDENKLHIKSHEDNRNFGPAASISVFEDKRDELNSGLFFDQAGSKVYAGPGMTVAHFHTREARHGVQSPMYGRRYSLSIYNGVQAELQARLKAAGAVFLCTAERNALKDRFAALRDQYLSQSLLVP